LVASAVNIFPFDLCMGLVCCKNIQGMLVEGSGMVFGYEVRNNEGSILYLCSLSVPIPTDCFGVIHTLKAGFLGMVISAGNIILFLF